MTECLNDSDKGDDCNTVRVIVSFSRRSISKLALLFKNEKGVGLVEVDNKGFAIIDSAFIGKPISFFVMCKEFFIPELKPDTVLRV